MCGVVDTAEADVSVKAVQREIAVHIQGRFVMMDALTVIVSIRCWNFFIYVYLVCSICSLRSHNVRLWRLFFFLRNYTCDLISKFAYGLGFAVGAIVSLLRRVTVGRGRAVCLSRMYM